MGFKPSTINPKVRHATSSDLMSAACGDALQPMSSEGWAAEAQRDDSAGTHGAPRCGGQTSFTVIRRHHHASCLGQPEHDAWVGPSNADTLHGDGGVIPSSSVVEERRIAEA